MIFHRGLRCSPPADVGKHKTDEDWQVKLARHLLILVLPARIHREAIYLCLLVSGLWLTSHADHRQKMATTTTAPEGFLSTKSPTVSMPFDASVLQDLDHLVLVAGHAVLDPHSESLDSADRREGVWHLLDYQRNQDMPKVLVSHIQSGVRAAAADPKALLVFSGGQTRPEAGPHDEGGSYYRVAEHYGWWNHDSTTDDSQLSVAQRTVTEDFAADSFQNLLFSICRFHEVVGKYPARITVVGFSFKMHRFADLHRAALRFPLEQFRYIGVDPPRKARFDLAKAELGEKRNSIRPFIADPYGCASFLLHEKRLARNPFRRTNPYPLSCPDLRALLEWCKPDVFPHTLPWTEGHSLAGTEA